MISVPERRSITDEFLSDNGITMPTDTTVIDNNDGSSLVIQENNAQSSTEQDNTTHLSDEELTALFDTTPLVQQVSEVNKLLIPENKIEHITDDARARFSGATWFEEIQKTTIMLAGLGGIGSNTLYCLSKMNPKQIFVYDDDTVELVNLAGQMYSKDWIGNKKVNAASILAEKFSDYHGVQCIPNKFTENTQPSNIMICGFDNMEARRIFFNSWREHAKAVKDPKDCLYIDGRLATEYFQVFCIRGDDEYSIDKYKKEQLFTSYDVEPTVCSYKQTAFCASMIGSIITNLFVNFVANKLDGMPRPLPYFTFYDASLMVFKTED